MHDNTNANQLRYRLAVIRHRIPGRLDPIRRWLRAVATMIYGWLGRRAAPLAAELDRRGAAFGRRAAGSRVGRLAVERVIEPLNRRLGGRLAGRGTQVAVGTLVLVLAGVAAIGAATNAGDPKPAGTAAVQQGVLARHDDGRADRSSRTPASAPPSVAASTSPKPKPAWVAPMPNSPITSCFGMRWGVPHQGIDFALPPGTPVHAIGKGTVIGAGWIYTGYGISVVIDHGNGYQGHYAHLQGLAVQAGQKVTTDQVIGYEGTTGDSTGPHLHFEIHHGLWHQVEPAAVLRSWGVPLTGC